jgi:hypothetical protein
VSGVITSGSLGYYRKSQQSVLRARVPIGTRDEKCVFLLKIAIRLNRFDLDLLSPILGTKIH